MAYCTVHIPRKSKHNHNIIMYARSTLDILLKRTDRKNILTPIKHF